MEAHLTVVQGNIKNEADVRKTLTATNSLPDITLFGVGPAPKFQMSLKMPVTADDPEVCQSGLRTLLSALRSLRSQYPSGKRPLIANISTTGISKTRDVPLALGPLYHWVLAVPHIDKKEMEHLLVAASREADSPIRGFTIIRPTLLSDGGMRGIENVKAGWVYPDDDEEAASEGEAEEGPHMGYLISRSDVGNWIYERIINGNGAWNGKCASLAY